MLDSNHMMGELLLWGRFHPLSTHCPSIVHPCRYVVVIWPANWAKVIQDFQTELHQEHDSQAVHKKIEERSLINFFWIVTHVKTCFFFCLFVLGQTDYRKSWQQQHTKGGGARMLDMWFDDLSQLDKNLLWHISNIFHKSERGYNRKGGNVTNKSIESTGWWPQDIGMSCFTPCNSSLEPKLKGNGQTGGTGTRWVSGQGGRKSGGKGSLGMVDMRISPLSQTSIVSGVFLSSVLRLSYIYLIYPYDRYPQNLGPSISIFSLFLHPPRPNMMTEHITVHITTHLIAASQMSGTWVRGHLLDKRCIAINRFGEKGLWHCDCDSIMAFLWFGFACRRIYIVGLRQCSKEGELLKVLAV